MEEVMTDYQYKQIVKMIYTIVKKCDTVEEVKDELEQLLEEKKDK